MKTLIIILLMFYANFLLLGHQQEMHQHITRESFQLLKYSFPEGFTGLNEMEYYLGTAENVNTAEDPVFFNSLGALKIVAGSWFEDEYDMVYHYGTYRVPNYNNVPPWLEELIFSDQFNHDAHTTISHFWDADAGELASTHLYDTIQYEDLSYSWEFTITQNALRKIRKLISGEYESRWIYPEAIDWNDYGSCIANDFNIPSLFDLYHGNGVLEAVACLNENSSEWVQVSSPVLDFPEETRKGIVYNLLGRMCHLLQDMSVPAHAHNTSHAGIYGMYSDFLESNEIEYLQEHQYWSAMSVFIQQGEFIDPYVYDDPIFYLMYFVNQIADFFPDGINAGDEAYDSTIPDLQEAVMGLENQLEPEDLNNMNCLEMYNILIPYAIRATAGLLYWFGIESGQIEQIPLPWNVTGQVVLSDQNEIGEITIFFDKIDSSHDVTITAETDGSFSQQFLYRQSGLYNIEISKEGYYPVELTDIDISDELELGEIILFPILSLEYVQVSQDNSLAAYNNISDAVEFLQRNGGGTIYVHPGTYSGEKNRNISWLPVNTSNFTDECHIRILAFQQHEAIVDCENMGTGFIFDNYGMQHDYSDEDEISGLIIRNGVQGIRIENGRPLIQNNIIEHCTINSGLENIHGAGISCKSGAFIANNLLNYNTGNWDGNDSDYFTYGGGIYIENNTLDPAIVLNNQIINCVSQEGGAVYCTGSGPIILEGNLVKSNSLVAGQGYNISPGLCEGVCSINCSNLILKRNTIISNQKSEVNGGHALLIAGCDNVMIENNTISNNYQLKGIKLSDNNNCNLLNNIVSSNQYGIYCWFGSSPEIDYCNVWNNEISNYSGFVQAGEHCLSENPNFSNEENDNFNLEWSQNLMSCCIDRGSPLITDLDQTPSDIGSKATFWHDYHVCDLSNNGFGTRYRWVSFPVLDREIVENATDPRNILNDLTEENLSWINILSPNNQLHWTGLSWEGDIENLFSQNGYKIQVPEAAQVPISGYKLPDNTLIHLEAGEENWIGYFIEEPQGIFSAFESIWDNLISVASEDWFFVKEGVYPQERCSLIYGKMYIVRVSESCDLNFGCTNDPVIPRERTFTNGFNYSETSEYAALVIEGINDSDILEIGVFMGQECIGAASVEEFPLQILAFLPEDTREEDNVSFCFYTDDRAYKEPDEVYIRYQDTAEYLITNLILEPYEMVSVKFENDQDLPLKFSLANNYPNPFNVETYIKYTIADNGNVKLQIYNLKGQIVRNLVDELQYKGSYIMKWDGKDDYLNEVSSGLYFYRLSSDKASETQKMVLLK
ncbi:MAG: hypothetical protein APR54_01875 [Candidatus Cloacimonas sp. SDB]|nr:MAG: hypothetical protein APR54_01875 [Candidatus Cloacimonas sp. SDB]